MQAAQDVFNADEAVDVNKMQKKLPSILKRASEVFMDTTRTMPSRSPLIKAIAGLGSATATPFPDAMKEAGKNIAKPLRPMMNDLRIVKSQAEIRNMRKAGQASARAFTEAMRNSFSREAHLEAFLNYHFTLNGCDGQAYVPVVAGGKNASTIHYVRNDDVLNKGELVLVDAGGEYGGYITDITRTWPVNGKFDDAQKDLYNAILKVQRSCVSMCREDADVTLDKLHKIAESSLCNELSSIGFNMAGDVSFALSTVLTCILILLRRSKSSCRIIWATILV